MAASFIQSASNGSILASVEATLSTTPIKSNLLVAAVSANVLAANIAISGWSSATTVAVGLLGGLKILYKICDGTDTTSIIATGTLATLMDLHVYEFTGFNTTTGSVLDVTATTADSGIGVTSRSSGTTGSTANADELVFTAVGTVLTNGGSASWTNSYIPGITTTDLMSGYLIPITIGTQNSTASWATLQRAAGTIATFIASSGSVYSRIR